MDVCWEDAVRRGDGEIVRDLLPAELIPTRAIGMGKRG
jgi:hypothetical protein